MSGLGEFLSEQVYPRLDAVEAGLLESFNPKRSGKVYYLDCPACQHKRAAYYYPNSAVIRCNRLNNCGAKTTIWDVLAARGLPAKDIVVTLARAVGVEDPGLHRKDGSGGLTPERKASEAIRNILIAALDSRPDIAEAFREARGWSPDHFAFVRSFGLGYYPDRQYVVSALREAGVSLDVAEVLDYIRPRGKPNPMDNRIVFFWEQDSGITGLVGRAITAEQTPKYRFTANLSKARPALSRGVNYGEPVFAVEGLLDSVAIRAVGSQSVAIGGDHVTVDQAKYLAGRCPELIHVVDADMAGYQGALKSIENCEPLGIHVSVVMLPPGSSDPDEMVSTGQGEALQGLLRKPVSAGAYAAGFFLHHLETTPADGKSAAFSRFAAIERLLTPPSAFEYRQILRGHDLLGDTRPYALRLLANLAAVGLMEAGQRNIRRIYGLAVEVSAADPSAHIPPASYPDILRCSADILEARLEESLPATLAREFGAVLTFKEA